MSTEESKFHQETGYNQRELTRQFILTFSRKFPHINIQAVPMEKIQEFLEQEYIVECTHEKKMDFLQDYLISQGLCEVTE